MRGTTRRVAVRRWTGSMRALALCVLAAVMLLAFGASAALAFEYPPISQPQTSTDVVDGYLTGLAPGPSDTTYLFGEFGAMGKYTGTAAVVTSQTGELSFDGAEPNSTVWCSISDGVGGYYLGGTFEMVGRTNHRMMVAHVLASGELDSQFDAGEVVGDVRALALDDGLLYIGGTFVSVQGQARYHLAKLNASTGLLQDWAPDPDGNVGSLLTYGDSLVVAGQFTTIGGGTSGRLAAVDMTTGLLDSGAVPTLSGEYAWQGVGNALGLIDGRYLLAGGSFSTVTFGGDSFPRANLVFWDMQTRGLMPWNPNPNNTVSAIDVHGDRFTLGGYFTNVDGGPAPYIAGFDMSDLNEPPGLSFQQWPNNPVEALCGSDAMVYAGGQFTAVTDGAEEIDRPYAAAFAVDGDSASLDDWNPRPDQQVRALTTLDTGMILMGGSFKAAGTKPRRALARVGADGKAMEFDPGYFGGCNDAEYGEGAVFGLMYGDGQQLIKCDRTTGEVLESTSKFVGEARCLHVFSGYVYVAMSDCIVRFSTESLELDDDWLVPVDGNVSDMLADGGTLFVAGRFTELGGESRMSLGAVDIGTASTTSWNAFLARSGMWDRNDPPEARSLVLESGRLYVAGSFTRVGFPSRSQPYLAAFDVEDGSVVDEFQPVLSGPASCIAYNGASLWVGSNSPTIGDIDTYGVFQVDLYGEPVIMDGYPNIIAEGPPVRGIRPLDDKVFFGGSFDLFLTPEYWSREPRSGLVSYDNPHSDEPPPVIGFAAKAGSDAGEIDLSWVNPDFGDFDGVRILRSTTGPALSPYPGSGQTQVYQGSAESFTDSGRETGVLYVYTAFVHSEADAWSRSAVTWFALGGSGGLTPTALTCSANHDVVPYSHSVTVSTTLTADGVPKPGAAVELWASTNNGGSWFKVANGTDRGGGRYSASYTLRCNTYFEWRYAGDSECQPALSTGVVLVKSRAYLGQPYLKYGSPVAWTYFRIRGSLYPAHATSTEVTLKLYKRVGGHWVWKRSTVYGLAAGKTVYSAKLKLGAGRWRVVAQHYDANHAATSSQSRDFTVRAK